VRRVAQERRSCFAAAIDHCGSPPVLQKDRPRKDAIADRGARGVRAGGPVDTTTRGGRPRAGGRPGLVSTGSTSQHPGGHQPGAAPTIVPGSCFFSSPSSSPRTMRRDVASAKSRRGARRGRSRPAGARPAKAPRAGFRFPGATQRAAAPGPGEVGAGQRWHLLISIGSLSSLVPLAAVARVVVVVATHVMSCEVKTRWPSTATGRSRGARPGRGVSILRSLRFDPSAPSAPTVDHLPRLRRPPPPPPPPSTTATLTNLATILSVHHRRRLLSPLPPPSLAPAAVHRPPVVRPRPTGGAPAPPRPPPAEPPPPPGPLLFYSRRPWSRPGPRQPET
jgi:hypothetical protein